MLKTLALTLTLLLSFTVAACSSTSGTSAKIDQTKANATQTAPTDAVQADTRQPRRAYRQTQWHQSCRGFFEPAATGTDLQRFQ